MQSAFLASSEVFHQQYNQKTHFMIILTNSLVSTGNGNRKQKFRRSNYWITALPTAKGEIKLAAIQRKETTFTFNNGDLCSTRS